MLRVARNRDAADIFAVLEAVAPRIPCKVDGDERRAALLKLIIGTLYRDGQGVTQDYAEAMRWFRLAADRGNAIAQMNIGTLYRNGRRPKRGPR